MEPDEEENLENEIRDLRDKIFLREAKMTPEEVRRALEQLMEKLSAAEKKKSADGEKEG